MTTPTAPAASEVRHVETVWRLLSEAIDATGPEQRELFLTRLVLILAVDGADTEAFSEAVRTDALSR